MQRNILSSALVFLLVSPVMAIVTNNTSISETDPSGYSSYNLSSLDWDGVYQYGTSVGKTMTAVDTYWLVTSRHYTLSVGNTFTDNGITYTIQEVINHTAADDPNHSTAADLTLIRVDKALSTCYDIYEGSSIVNKVVAMVGTGHAAGTVSTSSYTWSDSTTRVERWGTNKVDSAGIATIGGYTEDYLAAAFNLSTNTTTYEAGGADHDSGGAWLVYNTLSGTWELTGISIAIAGTTGAYTGSYAIDLRNYADWIHGVVPEPATAAVLILGGIAILRRRKK